VATLRFEVKGHLGAITLRAFMEAIAANVRMLKDYERGISNQLGAPANSLTWGNYGRRQEKRRHRRAFREHRQRCGHWSRRTKKAISCNFGVDDALLRLAAGHLGDRVIVRGKVYRNARGEPMRVDVEHLRVLRPDSELPSTESLTGSRPDLTGELSTEEHLHEIRSA